MRYDILVVIFRTSLLESETIHSLKKSFSEIDGSTITIWDNSPVSLSSCEFDDFVNLSNQSNVRIKYKHTPQNLSLSEIYNQFRQDLVASDNEFLILFDQDTTFDELFFKSHVHACSLFKSKLYLPKIIFKSKSISPAYFYYFKGFYFKEIPSGIMSSSFKTAINSSMIIKRDYFVKEFSGYPLELKYYGTDDYFMRKYAAKEQFFFVLDYKIEHDLTYSFDSDSLEKVLQRYKEANRAMLFNSEGRFTLIVKTFLLFRSVFLAIKYKRIDFLDY